MATYVLNPNLASDDPRCDEHSRFTDDGFPLPLTDDAPRRGWTPLWGGSCEECGKPC